MSDEIKYKDFNGILTEDALRQYGQEFLDKMKHELEVGPGKTTVSKIMYQHIQENYPHMLWMFAPYSPIPLENGGGL